MPVGPDVVELLVEDHREIERLLDDAVDGAKLTADESDRRLAVGIAELARHIAVEEEYLYPLVREILPNGDRMSADGLSLDAEAEVLMKQLERSQRNDRAPLVTDLVHILRRHVQTTEGDLFPALRHWCARDQLEHLAGVVELAKRTAPTHAHPKAPTSTPWNQILSPGIGLVDKARDAVTRRPTRPEQL